MKVRGEQIEHSVIDQMDNRIARGNFTNRDIADIAYNLGVKYGYELATRLIQKNRIAHRIYRPACSFIWMAGEKPVRLESLHVAKG